MNEIHIQQFEFCLQFFEVTENVVYLFTMNAHVWIGSVWFDNFIELICYGSIENACVLFRS